MGILDRTHGGLLKRGKPKVGLGVGEGIKLLQSELFLSFLVGIFSITHELTQPARILAIERFHQRLADRGFLRVVDGHAGPRHRLEKRPVTAHTEN